MAHESGAYLQNKHISFANDATHVETEPLMATGTDQQMQNGSTHAQTIRRSVSLGSMQGNLESDGPFKHYGMFLLAISGVFGAITALLVHMASKEGFGAVEIGWARSMVQTAISGTIILYQRQSPITPPEFIPYYIGRGMFGMGGVTCLYYGFAVLPIADATALYYTLPIPTAIFAWVFLGESYGGVEVLAAMTGLLGVFCITRPPFLWPFPSPSHHDPTLDVLPEDHSPAEVNLGYVACLCGALLTSMAFITIRRVGKRTTAWVLTFWHGVSGVGVCGVLMVVLQQLKMPDSWEHLALLASVGVFALLVQVLVNKGLQLEAAGPGALMTNLQLVWAYLLQVTFQHKPIIGWCVFGAVLIVSATAGTFLYNSYRDKHVQSDRSALKRTKSAEMSVLSIEAPQQGDDEYQQI